MSGIFIIHGIPKEKSQEFCDRYKPQLENLSKDVEENPEGTEGSIFIGDIRVVYRQLLEHEILKFVVSTGVNVEQI